MNGAPGKGNRRSFDCGAHGEAVSTYAQDDKFCWWVLWCKGKGKGWG
jgi:hypothetical protein